MRYYFAFIAIVLAVSGFWLGLRRWRVASQGVDAMGWISGYEERQFERHTHYFPIVEFADAGGTRHRFTAVAGGSRKGQAVGETVTVRYLPDRPEQAFIHSWFHMWAAPAALLLLAIGAGVAWLRG